MDYPHEAAAQLLSTVAYPNPSDAAKQATCFDNLCWFALSQIPLWLPAPLGRISVNLAHAMRDQTKARNGFQRFQKSLQRNLVAGRMAIALLQQEEPNPRPLPFGMRRISINAAAEFVTDEEIETEAANVKSRIWKPSLPVIHVAAALGVVAHDAMRAGKTFGLQHALFLPEVLAEILDEAERNESRIEAMAKPFVDPARLIRFRQG